MNINSNKNEIRRVFFSAEFEWDGEIECAREKIETVFQVTFALFCGNKTAWFVFIYERELAICCEPNILIAAIPSHILCHEIVRNDFSGKKMSRQQFHTEKRN